MAGNRMIALRKLSRRSETARRDAINIRTREVHRITIFLVFSCDVTNMQRMQACG